MIACEQCGKRLDKRPDQAAGWRTMTLPAPETGDVWVCGDECSSKILRPHWTIMSDGIVAFPCAVRGRVGPGNERECALLCAPALAIEYNGVCPCRCHEVPA